MGWLSGLSYRVAVNVTNTLSNQIDYQIEVVLGSSFPYNYVSFEDGRDIRVCDVNANILPYWIESFSKSGGYGIIWFKATRTFTIYLIIGYTMMMVG